MRLISLPDKPLFDLILLGFMLALLFGAGLGARPYSAPSEARYIEIGREMAESGDFVTPRLNYVKYFEKPPLFYWIQAENTKLFGIDPFSARIPTALFSLALCLLTYALGRTLYGRFAGVMACLVLATSLYMFALSRIVLLDVPVSFFMAATLASFLYAERAPKGVKRTTVIYAMYVAAAGAVLTKGLIGAVLPGAVVFLWLLCTRRWSLLKDMRLVSGTLLFLIIAAPWHILVAMRNPEWAQFYFIHEHFERYLTQEAKRYQPVWFFVAVLLAGLFPWTLFLAQAKIKGFTGFWSRRFEDGTPLFLMLWIGFIFIFFSLSDSKLIPYILPIFPPLAALIGRYLADVWHEKQGPGFSAGIFALIASLVAIAVVPSLVLGMMDKDNKVAVAMAQGGDELRTLSFASMVAAGALLVVFIQGRKKHLIAAMFIVAVMVLELGDMVAAHYNRDSMQEFAKTINAVHQPGDETAMYQNYYQDMPVYIGQRITIADWKGELEFGSEHEDTSSWMMTPDAFWKRWLADDHRMFLVMRQDAYERLTKDKRPDSLHLNYLQSDGRNMLFLNRNPMELKKKPATPPATDGKKP